MTDKTITFESSSHRGLYIEIKDEAIPVDAVKIDAGDTITFVNELNGNAVARIEFFRVGGSKASTIPGFCKDYPGTVFEVPKDDSTEPENSKDCEVVAAADAYAYKVSSSGRPAHTPLDPVIIIQPEVALMDDVPAPPGDAAFLIGGFFIGVLASLVVGLLFRE